MILRAQKEIDFKFNYFITTFNHYFNLLSSLFYHHLHQPSHCLSVGVGFRVMVCAGSHVNSIHEKTPFWLHTGGGPALFGFREDAVVRACLKRLRHAQLGGGS